MRRPWLVIAVASTIVAVLASPVLDARLNVPRAEVLPRGYDSREGERLLTQRFDLGRLSPVIVVVRPGADPHSLARELSRVSGVKAIARVEPAADGGAAIDVVPAASPFSDASSSEFATCPATAPPSSSPARPPVSSTLSIRSRTAHRWRRL